VNRRLFVASLFVVAAAVLAGCSGKKKVSGGLDRLPAGAPAAKRPKGPQTMGNLLLDAYIDDLKSPQADKRIRAARELGNMGSDAKKALPALEAIARDTNPEVSAAAKQAVTAIRKR
jgi:HEAT repeat protein